MSRNMYAFQREPRGELLRRLFAYLAPYASTLVMVLSTCDRLYGWVGPEFPEDLALMRVDGTEILGSIAHERTAWLRMTDEEFALLVEAVPEVSGMAVGARMNPLRLTPPDEMDDDDLSDRS